MPYLSLATPFADDPYGFFYEQKVPGMTADGTLTMGDRTVTFAGAGAVTDWGRGQWPATVTWRWASASGTAGGVPLAMNFGERRPRAAQTLVVHDGAAPWVQCADAPRHPWTWIGRRKRRAAPPAPRSRAGRRWHEEGVRRRNNPRRRGALEVDGLPPGSPLSWWPQPLGRCWYFGE
jgi:hypothetical protein